MDQQDRADQSSSYVPNPQLENEAVIQAFLDTIRQRLADPVLIQEALDAVGSQSGLLVAAHRDWVVDEQAASNLRVSAVVLAAYRALEGAVPRDELLALVREAFTEPLRETVQAGTRQWLDEAPDAYHALVGISKSREAHYFGDAFAFERPRDDDAGYYADVRRCLWHSFFVAEGAPELTPIFCAFDEAWIGGIVSARHGVRFERATTLGRGGSLCPFHFFRVAKGSQG